MNISDDLSNEPVGEPAPRDPIVDRLHREAMTERPAVSPALHRQILKSIYDQNLAGKPRWAAQPSRWLPRIAAAALLAAGIWAAWWTLRSHRALTPAPPPTVVEKVLPPPSDAAPIAAVQTPLSLSVDLDGILFASVWPPELRIDLPIPAVSPSQEPLQAQPDPSIPASGMPEWLLAGLDEPTNSARAALSDLIPPNFQALGRLITVSAKESQE